MFEVRPVTRDDAPALVALMKREGCPCFCRFWHFGGTNKEWEARCAHEAGRNEGELVEAIAGRSDEGLGLVARGLLPRASPSSRPHPPSTPSPSAGFGEEFPVVGWMKLTWRRALPKLTARVPYRDLDGDDVLSIGCLLVDPTMRRRGVARALVRGAIEQAPKWGARFVEAYPRRSEQALHDGEAWMGPERVFVELGFEIVREAPQYPVLRRAVHA